MKTQNKGNTIDSMETMTATFAFQLSLFPFMPFKTIIYYSCITVLKNFLFEYYHQEVPLYLLLNFTTTKKN